MFKSARVKLTLFYLAILLGFSLTLTLGTRLLTQREINSANTVQRGDVRRLFSRLYSIAPRPYHDFNTAQDTQAEQLRERLNEDVLLINIAALIVGGMLSYWYAGRALRPIEEAHESQKRFASDASHELRTPLANMRLENEVFLHQKKFSTEDAKKLIQSNLEEVQRLESLSGSLLALTQYGQTTLPLGPVDPVKIFAQAAGQVNKLLADKQVNIEKTLSPALVVGNTESLEQLLVIMLDNAIKYGPQKGAIFIHGASSDGQYTLTIQDEGPGIDEADLPHIFERLYRGDKARTGGTGGYGLGLALAAEIARANRASLTAANDPKGGAVFSLTVPVAK